MKWDKAMSEPLCICEHEPHDGECPERVGQRGATFPCGCDEYCPTHPFACLCNCFECSVSRHDICRYAIRCIERPSGSGCREVLNRKREA